MYGHLYDILLLPAETLFLGRLREELLSHARGHTLEIGAGTGLNFSHYAQGVKVTGVDVDSRMLQRARRKINRGVTSKIVVQEADAQSLPFPDEEFDTVVATFVFCSIPNPAIALEEVSRTLKPGGRFLLLEHIRRDHGMSAALQDTLTPLWRQVAGNCHLNRSPQGIIGQLPFRTIDTRSLWSGLGKLWILEITISKNSGRDGHG